jgi:glyoxylase I family protein
MTARFHHLHLICKDLEKMIDFFMQNLGAALVRKVKFGTADGATLDLGGTLINLRVARIDEKIPVDSSTQRFGYDHLGIEVDDLAKYHADLTEKGYRFISGPMDQGNNKIAFFKGEEDITIELLQIGTTV